MHAISPKKKAHMNATTSNGFKVMSKVATTIINVAIRVIYIDFLWERSLIIPFSQTSLPIEAPAV